LLLLLALAVVGLWLAGSYAAAYRLTRRPHPRCAEPVPDFPHAAVQSFRLATDDGEDLGAWFVPGRPDRPLVLILPGNGCDRASCLNQAGWLAEDGCSVLLLSLRAHGDSTGEVNDFGFSARHDVNAAVAWAETNHPGRPIVVWGRSLGSAAALFAAKELGRRVRGYVLECPYRDLRTAVRNRTRLHLPPLVDGVTYFGLMTTAPLVLPDVDRVSPLEAAGDVPEGIPVLILAGGKDRRARPDEAAAIRERIGPGAELVVIEDGDHLALEAADARRIRDAVRGLISRCSNTTD
jgi:uncharacterized protein